MIDKDAIHKRRDEITLLAARYGAHDVRIFGSVVRGDTTDEYDLDLLVRFEPGRSLLDQGGLLMDLRELLGIKVDVISEGALSGRFGEMVRREAVPLREAIDFGCRIDKHSISNSLPDDYDLAMLPDSGKFDLAVQQQIALNRSRTPTGRFEALCDLLDFARESAPRDAASRARRLRALEARAQDRERSRDIIRQFHAAQRKRLTSGI